MKTATDLVVNKNTRKGKKLLNKKKNHGNYRDSHQGKLI